MTTYCDAERAAIARGWAEFGLTQDEYAEQFGIAGRTLRLWLARSASDRPPLDEARAVLVGAIERLKALLSAVDARAACQAEPGAASPAAGPACRSAVVRESVEDRAAANSTEPAPVPRTTPGNARHADLDTVVAGAQAELMKPQRTGSPSAFSPETLQPSGSGKPLRAAGFFASWTGDEEDDATQLVTRE